MGGVEIQRSHLLGAGPGVGPPAAAGGVRCVGGAQGQLVRGPRVERVGEDDVWGRGSPWSRVEIWEITPRGQFVSFGRWHMAIKADNDLTVSTTGGGVSSEMTSSTQTNTK